MKYFNEFMNQYGLTLIHSIAVAIISYVSIALKRIYKKYVDDKTKKDVVKMVCRAINRLYPTETEQEKLNQAVINAKEILTSKEINISDLELRMYIEYSFSDYNCQSNITDE